MRVFLSSTCYDLPDIRARLERYLHEHGHVPLLSDSPKFPVPLGQHRHDVCVELAGKADLLIILIDSRYGAPFVRDPSISVTWAELRSALSNNVPVRAFVRKSVFDERNTWKKNLGEFKPAHCDNTNIFRLLDEIQKAKPGIWCQQFNNAEEIVDHLDAMPQAGETPSVHEPAALDYQPVELTARQALDAGTATLRQHNNLRAARAIMEVGLKAMYGFSLADSAWRDPPYIANLILASRDFRCFGDLLRTQREMKLAFAMYTIAKRLMASAGSNPEVDCEGGKRLSSLGDYYLRLCKEGDSTNHLEMARAHLLDSVQLHKNHPPCWFELFQSYRLLADALLARGDSSASRDHLDQAEQCWKLAGAGNDPSTRRLFGWLRRSRGDYHVVTDDLKLADTEYDAALDIFRNDGDLLGMAVILRRLALVSVKQGNDALAAERRADALNLIKSIPGAENLHEEFEQSDDTRPHWGGIVSLP